LLAHACLLTLLLCCYCNFGLLDVPYTYFPVSLVHNSIKFLIYRPITGHLIHALLCFALPFQIHKMNVIIGSSRSSKLDRVFKENHSVEVWSRPGGTYNSMKDLVDQHSIYHHGGPAESDFQTHFYIVAGVCDVTNKVKNDAENYAEIIFSDSPESKIEKAKDSAKRLQNYILSFNYIPIFCTIVPAHIETQNLHNFQTGKTSSLKHSPAYNHMQDQAMQVFRSLNKFIPELNS
jgi:hypothetical protein